GALHGAPTKRRMVKGITIRARDAQKTRAEEMLASLHESHWLTRKYAVEVLGTLGDPRAVGPLIEALTDEVNDIRQRAYESLIKIGAPSVPAVASLLTHEDDDLRQVASEIIRKVGKPAVEPLTEVMLTRSEERRVGKECRSRWWPYHLKKKLDIRPQEGQVQGCIAQETFARDAALQREYGGIWLEREERTTDSCIRQFYNIRTSSTARLWT